jgi:hypothetical protein
VKTRVLVDFGDTATEALTETVTKIADTFWNKI